MPMPRGGGLRSWRVQSNCEKLRENCGKIAGNLEEIAMPQPNLPKPQGATLLHRQPLLDLHHLPIAQPRWTCTTFHPPTIPSAVNVVSLDFLQRTQRQLTPRLI